ncbi:MAG: PEP-CTERM sorting domain-containing protein [Planctomycetota bacterium]
MACREFKWLFALPLAFLLLSARPALAEFTLSIEDTTIAAGSGSVTLDVGITPDGGSAAIADFVLILEITPLEQTGDSTLRFVPMQSEAFLTDADYVFAGNSDVFNEGDSAVFSVTADELVLEDLTANFEDAVFSTQRLMATFDVEHLLGSTAAPATRGDQYLVSISNESDFGNAAGDPIFSFTSRPGTLTITAIPEPSMVSMLLLCGSAVSLRRKRR